MREKAFEFRHFRFWSVRECACVRDFVICIKWQQKRQKKKKKKNSTEKALGTKRNKWVQSELKASVLFSSDLKSIFFSWCAWFSSISAIVFLWLVLCLVVALILLASFLAIARSQNSYFIGRKKNEQRVITLCSSMRQQFDLIIELVLIFAKSMPTFNQYNDQAEMRKPTKKKQQNEQR